MTYKLKISFERKIQVVKHVVLTNDTSNLYILQVFIVKTI